MTTAATDARRILRHLNDAARSINAAATIAREHPNQDLADLHTYNLTPLHTATLNAMDTTADLLPTTTRTT